MILNVQKHNFFNFEGRLGMPKAPRPPVFEWSQDSRRLLYEAIVGFDLPDGHFSYIFYFACRQKGHNVLDPLQ